MNDPSLNETEAARRALDELWGELAPIVNYAKELEAEVARSPSLAEEPWVVAHLRWLNVFKREIAAVQTVNDAAASGGRLSADDIRAARAAAEKLLAVIQKARRSVHQPA